MRFPFGKTSVLPAQGYRTLSSLLEIRILSATISWQFRNVLGEKYNQVPSFSHAAPDELLRHRWEFTN